jgi:hypothetical protein
LNRLTRVWFVSIGCVGFVLYVAPGWLTCRSSMQLLVHCHCHAC